MSNEPQEHSQSEAGFGPSAPEAQRASIWSWPDATPGARAAAFVLDSLIIGAMWGLIQVFFDRFFESWLTDVVQTFGLFSYLVGFQLGGGRTVGQRIVGLKLISLDSRDIDDGVPLGRLALREFVFFPLGLIGLGLGLLMIIVRKDRMALHDLLARTRVVALSQEPSAEPVRLSVVLGVLSGLTTITLVAFFGIVYLTPYPLRPTLQSLELLGYRVGRISGNLSSGFRIERVAFENDELALELKDVRFRYLTGEKGASVENLTVGEAMISFHRIPEGFQWPSVDLKMAIDSADVKSVTLQLPERPPLFFKRVFLSEVDLDQHLGAITMGRIWVDSEAIAADIQDFILQGRAIGAAKSSHLTLKPSLDPEVIARPIDLVFDGFYQDGVYDKFHLEAFKGRVKLDLHGRGGEMTLSQFTPAHFLRTELPLWNFNVTAKLDLAQGKVLEPRGSVELRNLLFAMDGAKFRLQRGSREYLIQPLVGEDWRAFLHGTKPAASLSARELASVKAILSEVYFQRPGELLSTSEVEMIDHDQRYFTLAPAQGEELPSGPRAPTSETR